MLNWFAWAQRSKALPKRPHLKQWKICCCRLAEKQRLVLDSMVGMDLEAVAGFVDIMIEKSHFKRARSNTAAGGAPTPVHRNAPPSRH
jgi:hypothetical protein